MLCACAAELPAALAPLRFGVFSLRLSVTPAPWRARSTWRRWRRPPTPSHKKCRSGGRPASSPSCSTRVSRARTRAHTTEGSELVLTPPRPTAHMRAVQKHCRDGEPGHAAGLESDCAARTERRVQPQGADIDNRTLCSFPSSCARGFQVRTLGPSAPARAPVPQPASSRLPALVRAPDLSACSFVGHCHSCSGSRR